MSFTAAVSATQSYTGSNASVSDISSYVSEPQNTFTSRTLSITDINGNEYGPGNFPFTSGNTWNFTLPKWDLSLRIALTLVSSNPQSGSVYSVVSVATLTNFSTNFAVSIGQNIASNPAVQNQVNYMESLKRLWTNIRQAINMGSYSQQALAQGYLDDIYFMYLNKTTFFG